MAQKWPQRKYGGPPPGHSGNRELGQAQQWFADGAPYCRAHYRPANPWPSQSKTGDINDPAQHAPLLNQRLRNRSEEYKEAMKAAGRGDEIDPPQGSAAPTEVPADRIQRLVEALQTENQAEIAARLDELEEYNRNGLSFDDRCRIFGRAMATVISSSSDPEVGRTRIGLLFDALGPRMPAPVRQLGQDAIGEMAYADRKRAAEQQGLAGQALDPGPKKRPVPLHMEDAAIDVLQSRSDAETWMHEGVYGYHPGVLFAAHASAFLGLMSNEALNGSVLPSQVIFDQMYPKIHEEGHENDLGYFEIYSDSVPKAQ